MDLIDNAPTVTPPYTIERVNESAEKFGRYRDYRNYLDNDHVAPEPITPLIESSLAL